MVETQAQAEIAYIIYSGMSLLLAAVALRAKFDYQPSLFVMRIWFVVSAVSLLFFAKLCGNLKNDFIITELTEWKSIFAMAVFFYFGFLFRRKKKSDRPKPRREKKRNY